MPERRLRVLSRVLSAAVVALLLNGAIALEFTHGADPLHDHQRCPTCILHHATSWSITPTAVVAPEAAPSEAARIPAVACPRSGSTIRCVARAPPC